MFNKRTRKGITTVISDRPFQRLQRLQVTAATEQNHLNLLNPPNPLFPVLLSDPFSLPKGN
jgi:hypothetical protein